MAEDGQGSSATSTLTVKLPAQGIRWGNEWSDGVHSHVKRMEIIHSDERIFSVHVEYIDKNGNLERGHKGHGYGHPGTTKQVIDLSYPTEFLTSIHGYFSYIIQSLTIETNNGRTFGPYGDHKADGTEFFSPLRPAKIVGFYGLNEGLFLKAIGVYVQPITKSMWQHQLELEPKLKPESKPNPKANEDYFSLGEYGGEDGECWVENFRAIRRLVIYSGVFWIISIQMEYEDENGRLVLSKKHGGDGGSKSEVVLEDPNEHLVTINGYYDKFLESKCNMIYSLTFITNKKSYGPFGFEHGTKFSFPSDERLKVVGIHGRSDSDLNAIGLNVVRTL